MTTKLLSMAGAALLATTSLVAAQSGQNNGTTIVPAGQSAPTVMAQAEPAKPAAPAMAPADAGTAPAKPMGASSDKAKPAAGDAAKADAGAKPEGDSKAAEAKPESGEKAATGEKKMSDVASMKVDSSPSADTKAEGNAVASYGDNKKPMDAAGNPTYEIAADGTADWYTWRGYKKYMANCMQCHGPDGMGSSFAPNLTDQLQAIDYFKFAGIVVSGQQNQWNPSGNSIMPAWGDDPNVMCSMDAIYVYLRSRADGVVGRGEPKRPPQTPENKAAQKAEYNCLGF